MGRQVGKILDDYFLQIDGQCSIHMGGVLDYQEVSSKNRN